ncbi:MAG: DoxX family protein [Candidatus Gracilibacteria bacterium]
MSTKALQITYWILTGIFAAFMFLSGIAEFYAYSVGDQALKQMGYPDHFLLILGTAKTFGAIALIQNKFKTIKEWAYAGFTFDLIGACVAISFAPNIGNMLFVGLLIPIICLIVMFSSYYLWKKIWK